jgi:predicted N-acetyltransferase YhbS
MDRLLPETARDTAEVEALLDLAFGPGRVALSSYRLRDGIEPVPGLCLVARDDYDSLAGTIRFWPVLIGAGGLRRCCSALWQCIRPGRARGSGHC